MAVENIIGLGFSPDVVQEKGKIIEALNEVYKAAQKIDGLRIEIKMSDSLKEFRKVTNDLQVQYEQLTKTIKDYNKIATEYQKAQEKAAEAEKKAAAAASATAEAQQQSAKSVKEVNSIYGSMIGTIERTLETLNNLKAQLNSNRQAQDNLNKDYQEGKIALQDYQTQLIQLAKEEKLLSQDIKQQNLYLTAQAKELISTEDSYDQLNAKLNQLERTWKSLNKTQREGEVGVNLQKEVAAARAELTKLDETIGNHQRKVGNYAGAWNGLGNSVSQLTRELPSFANSLQTGFMGISNNLPILGDEIKRIRLENAALKAEGKPTTSVLKQLGSAFFSWNTVMSIGITLLVVYGKEIGEWVRHLFNAKKSVDEFKISTELLNKTLKGSEFQNATSNIAKLKEQVKLAKEGFLDKDTVVKNYNSTMGKTTGQVKSLAGVEDKLVKDAPAYIEMVKQKAIATAAYGGYASKNVEAQIAMQKAAHDYAVELKAFNELYKNDEKRYELNKKHALEELADRVRDARAIQDEGDAYLKLGDKAETAAAKIATTNKFSFNGDDNPGKLDKTLNKAIDSQKKANEAQLQEQATLNKSMADLESIGYAARQGFLKKYYAVQQQIIADNAKYDLQKAELTNDEKLAIQQEAASKSLSLTAKYLAANAKLNEKAAAEAKEQYKQDLEGVKSYETKNDKDIQGAKTKSDNFTLDSLKNGAKLMNSLYESNYVEQQAALKDSLNNKEISQKEYEEKMYQLQLKYSKESLNRTIADAEQQMKYTTGATEEFYALKESIAKAKNELADIGKAESLRGLEKLESSLEKINDRTQALTSIMGKINDISYNNQKAELDELSQKMDDNYAKEVENINNSALTEEQKSNRLKIAEAKRDAQKITIEKRQKQADIEKANFDRLTNIANIISGTALAVVKALPNIPLAITAGAMGAAELAAAVATKIPQYADGTEDHPGGPAIVGEGKHKELVKTPDGKMSIADKPMLLDLPKHTQVIPLSREFIDREHAWQWQQIAELTKVQPIDHWEMMAREIRQLKMAYKEGNQGKTHVHNNIKVDLGWYEYIQRNVRGL